MIYDNAALFGITTVWCISNCSPHYTNSQRLECKNWKLFNPQQKTHKKSVVEALNDLSALLPPNEIALQQQNLADNMLMRIHGFRKLFFYYMQVEHEKRI